MQQETDLIQASLSAMLKMRASQVKREEETSPVSTSTAKNSITRTSFLYPKSVNVPQITAEQPANGDTVSFVHISDPYADEPHLQPPPQTQQHQHLQQPQFPTHPTSPQYVDVAATSLKAMIDPNLEQSTPVADQEAVQPDLRGGAAPVLVSDTADADHLNEAIRQALQNATEPARDEFGTVG